MNWVTIKNIIFLVTGMLLTANITMAADFTDNGDQTITDNRTDLIWQKEDASTTRNWEGAITYCEGLTLASQSDWRLPNIRELESIVDDSTCSPAIDSTYFPNTNSSEYWSSTTNAGGTSDAWHVDFSDGGVDYNDKGDRYYVRCVRGGQ